jgi:hypothetical protein
MKTKLLVMEKSKLLEHLEEVSPREMTLIENYFLDKLLNSMEEDSKNGVLSYVRFLQDEIRLLKEQLAKFEAKVDSQRGWTWEPADQGTSSATLTSGNTSTTGYCQTIDTTSPETTSYTTKYTYDGNNIH